MRRVLVMLIGLAVSGCRSQPVDRGFIACGNGYLHWDSRPLIAQTDLDVSGDVLASIRRGYDYWNEHVGLSFVDFGIASPDVADVFVGRDNGDRRGSTELRWDAACALNRAAITLPGLARGWILDRIAEHELGHALGLAHDDMPTSIMNPEIVLGPQDATGLDIERLRR